VGWFDRVGDAFNWVKDTAAPAIGGALATANHFATEDIPGISPILGGAENLASQGAGALGTAYSYGVARPVSTALQVGQTWGTLGHAISNLDDWRQAWNRSDSISPGQATVIDYNATYGAGPTAVRSFNMDPASVKAREDFFHGSWQGQVSSGALDLALNLGADPAFLGAKAIKGAAVARNTFKSADEVGNVLKVNAGEAAATSLRETGMSNRMNKLFTQLDGKTAAEIALHPVVKQSDQSGAFAYMFGRINQDFGDEAARRAAQRNVFGAMLGNGASIQALKDQHTLLANELQRLSDTPVTSKAVADFSWFDHGQGALAKANQTEPVEITAQKDLIEKELARLEAVTSATGTVNRLAGSLKEQSQYTRQLGALRQTTLNTGLGNLPVRVIGGAISNRLPGHVSVKDPVSGFEDLRNTLSQSKHLTGQDRRQLLDNYVNAATDGERQKAVLDAEGAIVHATAREYGLNPQEARKLLEAGNGRRQAVLGALSSRLYSGAPGDKFVHLVDHEDGEIVAYSRPILQSQIEDNVSIIDPRKLDAALKEAKQNRLLERVTGQIGDDAKNVATSAYTLGGAGQMVASDALGKVTRVWKDSALMRLAYVARVQIDSQMRLMTHMGALSYLGAATSGLKAEGKYMLSAKGSDSLSLRNVFKPGDYEKSIGDMLKGAGVHEDDIPSVVRQVAAEDGSIADLAQHMTDAQLARYRATGEWGYVDGANPAWAQAYARAVNRQIRNSPVAMKAAEGATTDELKAFVQSNPAARREWLNLKSSSGDDMDGWLANVQAHVDHYLPSAEMKSTALDREVGEGDVKNWFANVDDRMRVHGESYAPTAKSAVGDLYEKVRNNWYKMAAEAPESTMARAPLYSYAFKRNLKSIVEQHGLDSSDYKAIDGDLMMQYRKSADHLARREVGKILFDTSHSSNLSTTLRYVSPFFSAWEDMIKKWGGLFYDKPWAGVRFEQAWQAPNQAGLVVDENGNRVDAEGNRFDPNTGRQLDPKKDKFLIGKRELVTVPARFLPRALQDALGTGELDAATDKKRPASVFSIDKNSFNIVFQGDPWWLPGAGPIVQVPVNELVKHEFTREASNPVIQAILPMGVSDTPWQDQFLPSWIRQAHNAFGNTQDHANIQAMLLAQETARFQNGERGPIKPGEISDMTRNWFILRAITANASPVSMAPTPKAQFYIDQAHIYRQQYGQNWQEKFYKDFPQWYDMSLSLSNNDTGIVATLNAVDEAKKYRSVIADNPEYGWAVVGPANQYGNTPGSAFNQAAYAWQEQPIGYGQQAPFRGKSSPQEALAKVEASKGWMQYQTVMTKLNLVLETRGLHSFTQKGAEDLAGIKKATENVLGAQNPSWRQDFLQTDSGKVVNFLDWAQKAMSSNKDLAKRPDMQAIARYVQLRGAVQNILAQRSKHGLDANPDVKSVWDAANAYLRQGNIGFEQVFNRLLSKDDPSKELMGMEASQ
jgi:hypothetical protein